MQSRLLQMADEEKIPAWRAGVAIVDFDAIARGAWKSYWRPTPAQIEKQKKRVRKARRRALARRLKAAKAKRAQSPWKPQYSPGWIGPGLRHLIAVEMDPGRWYARPDILEATGLNYGSVKMTTQRMWRAGYLERAPDPAWHPVPYRKGVGIDEIKERPPKWLYRLTEAGEAMRREAIRAVALW